MQLLELPARRRVPRPMCVLLIVLMILAASWLLLAIWGGRPNGREGPRMPSGDVVLKTPVFERPLEPARSEHGRGVPKATPPFSCSKQ